MSTHLGSQAAGQAAEFSITQLRKSSRSPRNLESTPQPAEKFQYRPAEDRYSQENVLLCKEIRLFRFKFVRGQTESSICIPGPPPDKVCFPRQMEGGAMLINSQAGTRHKW